MSRKYFANAWAWVLCANLSCAVGTLAGSAAPVRGEGTAHLPPPVLMLQAQEPKEAMGYGQGILVREIARQAVLISARDELGLPTRDQALREPFLQTAPDQPPPLGVETGQLWESYRVSLIRGQNGQLARLRLADMPLMLPEERVDWLSLLSAAERQSRGLMVRRLRQIGFPGQTRPWGQAQVPAEVEGLLNQMDFVSQYLAVRRLHAELARQGDSEALLGALARGYAHLGVMTDYFWNATHKVYKARALLYAQRMVAQDPQSPVALRHRAYAFALCGLQGLAEQDLARAQELAQGQATPPWVAMVQAFCQYDWQRLQSKEWPRGWRPLGALLALLSVETHAGARLTEQAAELVVQRAPQCLRAYDVLCDRGGVNAGHEYTMAGPEALARLLAERLSDLKSLPRNVRDALPEHPEGYRRAVNRRAVALALVEAASNGQNGGEPSWAALGRMIEESNFAQISRRLYFLAVLIGVEQAELAPFAEQVAPAVEEHPLANSVKAYQFLDSTKAAALKALFDGLRAPDAGFGVQPLLNLARRCGMQDRESVKEVSQSMWNQRDQISAEISQSIEDWRDPQWKLWYARLLKDVDPHSPHAAATFIEFDWKNVEDRLPQWKKDYAWQPAVISALVPKLREAGQTHQAIDLLERYIQIAPAQWPFEELADIYLQQGQEEKWLATMERQLRGKEYGLEHSQVGVNIAWHFMEKQNFKRALPYAEAAAESWAHWAMMTAAYCNEGAGNWDRAEFWIGRMTQRYPDGGFTFAYWRERTGWHCGADTRAEEMATGMIAALHDPVTSPQTISNLSEQLGWLELLEDRPQEATQYFSQSLRERDQFWPGLVAAILANRSGDHATRDQMLQRLAAMADERPRWYGSKLLDLVKLVIVDAQPLDLRKFDDLGAAKGDYEAYLAEAVVCELLFETGRQQEATQRLAALLRRPAVGLPGYVWAWAQAREHGLDPVALRAWPAPANRPAWPFPRTQPSQTESQSPPPNSAATAPQSPPPAPL